jgi:hypothetical protein
MPNLNCRVGSDVGRRVEPVGVCNHAERQELLSVKQGRPVLRKE